MARATKTAPAILPSCICDASNNPFTIRTNKIEQVRYAVVHLAIHQKLERSPDHCQIVIDPELARVTTRNHFEATEQQPKTG